MNSSQILAAAGHDLRQPMHSLNLILDALAERAADAEIAALVNSAQISADGVTGVLEALLGIAAMESGSAAPAYAEFGINELLDHCREQFARRARNKNLDLRIVPSAHRVTSDRLLLRRILDTLLSNAIRHAEGGRILLGCRRKADVLRIGILHGGPGPGEALAAPFSPTDNQDGAPPKANWRGYALGLSIAQNICAALGHDISVVSREEKGAAIWIDVPLAEEERAAPALAAVPARQETDATIIIVEDNPDILAATTQLLAGWGYRVYGGATAAQAIQDFETNGGGARPDLVLSDFRLPDGQTAVDAMAALNRHFDQEIPAIIITGDPTSPGIAEARALNYEIIQKPLRAAKLRALVRYALDHQCQI